jgi:transposase
LFANAVAASGVDHDPAIGLPRPELVAGRAAAESAVDPTWYPWRMKPHALTDGQWERLRPLLPPQKPATGRPAKDHRTVVDGILWQLTTGRPWRDLPGRFGPWQTVYSRFRRWRQAGVWDRVLAALQAEASGDLDWARRIAGESAIRAIPPVTLSPHEAVVRPPAPPVTVSPSRSSSGQRGTAGRWPAW